jgi:hypothetical protein
VTPEAKPLVAQIPMRQIMRHMAPRRARAQYITDAVDHFPPVILAMVAGPVQWPQRGEQSPFGLTQIGVLAGSGGSHTDLVSPSLLLF